jgi:hypothetical protein
MNPETIAQIILKGMEIYLLIANDIPKERRVESWERFFKFLDDVQALGK